MRFKIAPVIAGKAREMEVEKIDITPTTETYRVTISDHTITLQNNRLLFRSKGLKHRKGWWKVIAGQFRTESAKEAVYQAIEKADPE